VDMMLCRDGFGRALVSSVVVENHCVWLGFVCELAGLYLSRFFLRRKGLKYVHVVIFGIGLVVRFYLLYTQWMIGVMFRVQMRRMRLSLCVPHHQST
jgi:uncharacterized membrane protein